MNRNNNRHPVIGYCNNKSQSYKYKFYKRDLGGVAITYVTTVPKLGKRVCLRGLIAEMSVDQLIQLQATRHPSVIAL